jgi:cytochrome c
MKTLGILVIGLCVSLSFSQAFSQSQSEKGGNAQVKKTASGDASAGKVLFEAKCAVCHSVESKEKRVGPSLKGLKDGKLPSGRNATHDVILDQLNVGGRGLLMTVNGFGMPLFRDLLSDKEKEDIIAYLMTTL